MNKKLKSVLAVAAASICVAAVSVVGVGAVDTDNYVKGEEKSLNSAESEVNHSMALASDSVTSNDKVNGILFAAGNNVSVKGINEYSVIAGSTVNMANTVEKDLFAAGGIVNIDKDTKVGRDLYAAGGVVNVSANVKGNVFLAASTVKISDVTIEGDLHIYAQSVIFEGNTTIKGSVAYNKDANVTGNTPSNIQTYEPIAAPDAEFDYGGYVMIMLIGTIGLLITAIVIVAIFPGVYRKLAALFREAKGGTIVKNALFGICALIATPIVGLLLLLTMVGLPLGLIVLGFYVLCVYLATAATGAYFGHLILTKGFKAKANAYLELTIGIVLLGLLALIPAVGWVFGLLAVLFGMGWIITLITRRKIKY